MRVTIYHLKILNETNKQVKDTMKENHHGYEFLVQKE